jgi:ribosome-binding factor A
VGGILRRGSSIEKHGLITVNNVKVTSDLHSAVVFASILGSDQQKKRGTEWLDKKRKRLQGQLAREVILKYSPELKFIVGDTIHEGDRILEILDELDQGSSQT